jgi:GNAT superfamily N-acetyltransferase
MHRAEAVPGRAQAWGAALVEGDDLSSAAAYAIAAVRAIAADCLTAPGAAHTIDSVRFDLTPEIIDQIIFAMENQQTPFVFDTQTRTVTERASAGAGPSAVRSGSDAGSGSGGSIGSGGAVTGAGAVFSEAADASQVRYVEIPEWSSADGFQLMERFVATLRNPLVGEKLRTALSSGKGVFRNFKNALKDHGEVERLWFVFKDREMKLRVIEWYNELCDMWGWERLSREEIDDEETEELVLSDFEFAEEDDSIVDAIRRRDRSAWDEAFTGQPSALVGYLHGAFHADAAAGRDPSLVIAARTPGGELAGFAWGIYLKLPVSGGKPIAVVRVIQLFVAREFRGLGIAKRLINTLCRTAFERSVQRILFDVPGSGEVLMSALESEGFQPLHRTLSLDVERWGSENDEE